MVSVEVYTKGTGVEVTPMDEGHGSVSVDVPLTSTERVAEGSRLGSEMMTEVTSITEAEGVATMEDDFGVATVEEEDSVTEVTPGITRLVGLPRVMTRSVGPLKFMPPRG